MDSSMTYYKPPRKLEYPCKWDLAIPPGQREVQMTFDTLEVSFEAPYTTVDEQRNTCALWVEAYSPHGFLVAFPGELDGTLAQRAVVPKSSLADLIEAPFGS